MPNTRSERTDLAGKTHDHDQDSKGDGAHYPWVMTAKSHHICTVLVSVLRVLQRWGGPMTLGLAKWKLKVVKNL